MTNPIFLPSYDSNLKCACIQRAWELIISTIIDPELERIKGMLLRGLDDFYDNEDAFYEYMAAIVAKEHEADELGKMTKFDNTVWSFLADPGEISDEDRSKAISAFEENRSQLYSLEVDTDLECERVYYYKMLQGIKDSILCIINNHNFVHHVIKKNKHSSSVWLYICRQFILKSYVASFEVYEELHNRIDIVDNEIDVFKKQFKRY